MNLAELIENSNTKTLRNFQGLTYAEIVNVNGLQADIEFKKFEKGKSGNTNYPKAYNVPIIVPGGGELYERGSKVIVAFAVSEIKKDGSESGDLSKFLSKDNCVILGTLKNQASPLDTWSLTFGTTEIRFGPVLGIAGGLEIYVAGVKIFGILSHQHPTAAPGPPSPPIPGL